MSTAGRKTISARAKPMGKEKVTTYGKENVGPFAHSRGGKFSDATTDQDGLRDNHASGKRRFSVSSSTDRNVDGTKRSVSEFLPKKTPFRVHCDERNAPKNSQPRREGPLARERPRTSRPPRDVSKSRNDGIAEEGSRRTRIPVKIEHLRPPRVTEVKERKTLEPRSRSTSSRPSNFVVPRINCRSKSSDPLGRSERAIFGYTGPRKDTIRSQQSRSTTVVSESRSELADRTGTSGVRPGTAITPIDFPPPLPLLPVKAAIRQSKRVFDVGGTRGLDQPKDRDFEVFPADLVYHSEYHRDLPIVEREREDRSLQLSENFLTDRVNAEQRKLVVAFLIRLGTHCRYPSYVVYQAVKLFDAVIDRIRVETAHIQLTALAALWIALKRQENFHKIPTATTIVALAKDLYLGREDLLMAYERRILLAVDFNVTFPDTFSLFAHHLISCEHRVDISAETNSFVYNCGRYLIDLTLLDETFCRVSASLIAITATELALGLALDAIVAAARPRWQFWRSIVLADYSCPVCTLNEEIAVLRVAMLRRVLCSEKKHSVFNVVYKKYKRGRYSRTSDALLERVKRLSFAETLDP